jgi:hypothetical protein
MPDTMPPPPTDTPVAGVGSGSEGDKLKGFLVNLTGGGMPMVRQQLEDAHAKRVAEADRNHKSYGELSQVLAGDTTGKYVDQQGNLTPEGQKIELQRKAAFDAWQKAAGVSKENKGIIGKLGQLTDKLVHHRAGGQPPQPGQGQPASTRMPQPPAAASPAGGSAPPTASGMPAPPNASPSASVMPTPPGYTPAGQDPDTLAARSQAESAEAAKLDLYKKEGQADADIKGNAATAAPKQLLDGLIKAGLSQEEAQKVVREKYSGIAGRPKSVMYSDPSDPTRKLFGTEVGGVVYDQQGESVPNAGQVVPAMLPSASSSTSVYNADTGTTTTSHSTQKIAPRAKTSMPAPPSGGSSKPSSSSTKPPTAGGGLAAMAEDWVNNGIVPQAKDKRQVEMYMKAHGQEAPVTLIPEAQKTIIAASPVMDQINGLLKDIDDLKLGDNNKSAYLLPARAEYALGHASPEGSLGKDIAGLSLGSVVEAASVLKGTSRSVLALKKALEHTPNPWIDSPKLMKEKLQTIQARLKDVMDDAYKYGKKGAAVGYGPSHMPAPPPRGTGTKDDPIIVSP